VAVVALVAVSVSSAAIPILAASAASSSIPALHPLADSWVNSSRPTSNYGSSTTLRIDGSPVWTAYLRFDLSGFTAPISRAVLDIHPESSDSAGLSIHRVSDTSWQEEAITAANAPAVTAAAVTSGRLVAGQTAHVDVTSLVRSGVPVSLAITDNDSTAVSLSSRESGFPPGLFVTLGSATSTPGPSGTPAAASVPTATQLSSSGATAPTTAAPTAPTTAAPTAAQIPTPVPTAPQTSRPTSRPTSPPTSAATLPASTPTTLPPTSANPIRATFYYPWFPEAWDQSGINPFTHYHPSGGFYNGASSSVVAGQIKAMQYGKISVGIASWWGQGSQTDAKMPTLLSTAAGTGFRWAIYYEPEGSSDPSVAQIASDLRYINSRYASDPSLYKINGKPVVFVYAQPADGCGMTSRWSQANASGADYIVLKVFPGYAGCAGKPDAWHQYSPAVADDHQAGYSYTISPGFWLTTSTVRLPRDLARWQQSVRNMVASREPWQLVTTFNEWGEGTAVESATEWSSASGYGAYLDVLHSS
jgi:hypothetical protein